MTTTPCPSTIPLGYAYASRATSARISLPVSKSQALYAHFEHVVGTPGDGQGLYSIDKLRILNAIIDRLDSAQKRGAAPSVGKVAPEEVDAMIETMGGRLHEMATKPAGPYRSAGVRTGELFTVAA